MFTNSNAEIVRQIRPLKMNKRVCLLTSTSNSDPNIMNHSFTQNEHRIAYAVIERSDCQKAVPHVRLDLYLSTWIKLISEIAYGTSYRMLSDWFTRAKQNNKNQWSHAIISFLYCKPIPIDSRPFSVGSRHFENQLHILHHNRCVWVSRLNYNDGNTLPSMGNFIIAIVSTRSEVWIESKLNGHRKRSSKLVFVCVSRVCVFVFAVECSNSISKCPLSGGVAKVNWTGHQGADH